MDWPAGNGKYWGKMKEANHIKIWLLRHIWMKRQMFSRQWPVKQKTGSGKLSETFSREIQYLLTSHNNTDRWRAVLQTPPSLTSQMPMEQYWRQTRETAQHYSKALSSQAIRTMMVKGKHLENAGQNPNRSWLKGPPLSQSWGSLKHSPDWAWI